VPFGPATAAVINLVAVNPAGLGNLRITPFGTAMPLASIINYAAGLTIANGPALALCDPSAATCSSDITVEARGSATHLLADVQGYFRRVSTGGVGTALLADSAVTAPKIGSGVVVRSLNGQTDAVTLAGANGLSVSQGSGTVTVASNATPANAAGAIVSRDGTGSFLAGSVGLSGNLDLPNTSASVGIITLGGVPFLHNFGTLDTFVGSQAGNTSMTGMGNSAFGTWALSGNTTGNWNSAFGIRALQNNSTGELNSAVGVAALSSNTTGFQNSAFGNAALRDSTTGSYNSAFGMSALQSSTTGSNNSAFGSYALFNNSTGDNNSAVGLRALSENTTGSANSAFGNGALQANTAGEGNSAVGAVALWSNTTASYNSAFGNGALQANTTGDYNSAFGFAALFKNTTGPSNSAFGVGALNSNTTGGGNSAFGNGALQSSTTGGSNVAVGATAGSNLTSGSNNVYIANSGAATESGVIHIGTAGVHTATYVAGISGQTSASGVAVYVNPDGKLGTATSSRRYKEQIADMSAESDVLLKLRPVSFYYRPELDETHLRQYGLVAEEVAEVAPELVAYDEDGAPQTVRYHFVNAMLLNEVQKQRRLVEEQRRLAEDQRQENEEQRAVNRGLEARLAKLEAVLAGDR
jgi:hypothetical protein